MRYLMMLQIKIVVCVVCMVSVTACADWNDHYDIITNDGSDMTLYETLATNSETSTFAKLAEQAGYDKILLGSQTYTVFAPTNDALSGFDSSSKDIVTQLMENHIARYLQPSSTSPNKGVKMLNGKLYYFDNSMSFSGSEIVSPNNIAKNGIIHHISSQIPFVYNVYEYMENHEEMSKLYEFIHSFDEWIFDSENSIEIDIDSDGRPIYDTIMVKYNRLLEDKTYGIGNIVSEDSVYTMILPNNTAWNAIYERISPSFKVYESNQETADSIQDIRTKLAIVDDLVFRGAYPSPMTQDSLETTTGSIIHNLPSLFGGSEATKVSNGYVFPVSELNYDNTETWNKPISVEAEEQNGRTYNNTTTSLYTRSVTNESLIDNVSGDSYIEVQPLTTSSNPSVVFDIPDVLAGTYNIYAVFLPSTVLGETEQPDSTKLSFTMSYLNANGRSTTQTNRSSDLITSSSEVTKMLAFEDFEFPVSDYVDNLWLMDDEHDKSDVTINSQLTVSTNVTTSEYTRGTYSRTFRLDRIILEPAKK